MISEERASNPSVAKVEQVPKKKQFKLKEQYDMYEMEFEDVGDSEEEEEDEKQKKKNVIE